MQGAPRKRLDSGGERAELAVRRAAHREAVEHFRRALQLLETEPADPERWRSELVILSQLAPALMGVHGWSAAEAGEAVERAAAVARRLESSPDVAPAIANLWLYDFSQGRLGRANEISRDLFRIAGDLDDPEILLQAHHRALPTAWHRGAFLEAREHAEAGLRLYDEARHAHHRYLYLGHDPAACVLSLNASLHVALGYPDRAASAECEAITLARRLQHKPTLMHALGFVCEARGARGDVVGIFAPAQEVLEMSREGGVPQSRAHALIAQGWAMAVGGEKEGIAKLQEAVTLVNQMGLLIFQARASLQMAEALGAVGHHAAGLVEVDRGFDIAGKSGIVLFLPRLHVARAELLLQSSVRNFESAEVSLRQAMVIARQQAAKGYELRAATRLAALWHERGRRSEAQQLLAPVYAWFTEGFETPHLKEAAALLSALA
jgi:tetratricopeptide (TPR) repeat protein